MIRNVLLVIQEPAEKTSSETFSQSASVGSLTRHHAVGARVGARHKTPGAGQQRIPRVGLEKKKKKATTITY